MNDQGHVANDVETEQILQNGARTGLTTRSQFPSFTSFLQHRGSIPLYWSQDNDPLTPKPPIQMDRFDPYFSAAALHFDNMIQRYGNIIVLNLVKSREKIRRESILLDEFTQCISYLNSCLKGDKKIEYIAWDMARASKEEAQDVIGTLQEIAEKALKKTGFFVIGSIGGQARLQKGIVRTNCIV